MKFLKEWINERIHDGDISYFDYNEFIIQEDLDDCTVKKATLKNWTVALKNLNNLKITESDFKEFTTKLKSFRRIGHHPNLNCFIGITKDLDGNYFSVTEYANEGNLRHYLKSKCHSLQWSDKIQMALDITRGLMCLHSNKIIYRNLSASDILVDNGKLMIAGFGLFKKVEATLTPENIYIEPQYLRDPNYKQDMKSDIYSLGILLWELSSKYPPFSNYGKGTFELAQLVIGIVNGKREDAPPKYIQLYQNCWQDDLNQRPEINEVYEILTKESFLIHFKLNHGLIITEHNNIKPSVRAVIVEDGELNKISYKGQPSVYTHINSRNDICIDFPVDEVTYSGTLSESFDYKDENDLRDLYGDFIAREFLVGGRLFIKDSDYSANSDNQTQLDILKFYLFCAYNSVKYSTEIQLGNLFSNGLPKMETLDEKKLNTYEELVEWMNNLYQKKSIVISYRKLVPISQLGHDTSSLDYLETLNEKQSGVANFKEKLNFEDWVGNIVQNNLVYLARNFNLFRGFVINKNNNGEIEISNEIAVDFIKIPEFKISDKSYAKLVMPTTNSELNLISNNILSIKDLNTFPFIKSIEESCKGYNHILVKSEQYEILFNKDDVKPTKEFEQAIERALNGVKPLKDLQDVFNKYGHLFPQRIILGRSLKSILPSSSSNSFDIIDLKSHLNNFHIPYLLTRGGEIIEKNDLRNWIQSPDNNLEVIEYDNIIPLYKVLEAKQQRKIDDILNNFKIIMTGITDLRDLDNNNHKHYKRISLESSLEDKYEVFGAIILKDNSKSKEFYVNFGSYDFNGFFAIIRKLGNSTVNITECYILWMIIAKPSKLSVFSLNNREFQVDFINKESITLRTDEPYNIKTHSLSPGNIILTNAYFLSADYEPSNIILTKWKDKSIDVQMIKSIYNKSKAKSISRLNIIRKGRSSGDKIDLRICVLSSSCKSLKIDNKEGEGEYSLDLIGYISPKEN